MKPGPGYNFNHIYMDLIIDVRKARVLGVEIEPENFLDSYVGRNYYGDDVTDEDFFLAWHAVTYMLEKYDEVPVYEEPEPVSGEIVV